jgi:hypothetical protein
MAECRWLKPVLVNQFEFVEWTPDGHLRHAAFVALREKKEAGRTSGSAKMGDESMRRTRAIPLRGAPWSFGLFRPFQYWLDFAGLACAFCLAGVE